MIKVRELISSNKEISLPIIIDCTEVFHYQHEKKGNVLKRYHVRSECYQTSKMSCKMSSKPLHVDKNEN